MIIKGLIDEDFCQYKLPSMFIIFPYCTFKCDKENGSKICQNSQLANAREIYVLEEDIVNRYMSNPITKAIVFGGLEPFDSYDAMLDLISCFRKSTDNDIVIYTGYYETEIPESFYLFAKECGNIIVKFGRYLHGKKEKYDNVLGVTLASDNQYAKKLLTNK